MHELPVFNDNTPLSITEEQLSQADKLLDKLLSSLQFFKHQLHHDPRVNNVHTHMSLFESYFRELSPLVSYDTILETEANQRYETVRKLNSEIRRLESLLGQETTADGISTKLREYDDIIRAWYGALGFQYASQKNCHAFGIQYEFTPELQYEPDDGCSGNKQLAAKFTKKFALISENKEFDIYKDQYHADLLDTDNNRIQIQKLFTSVFPNCTLIEFHSRKNDYDSFSLRFTVRIPYQDIETLYQSVLE